MDDWKANLTNLPHNSLLVSSSNGKLVRKYCPIPALCIQDIADIEKGEKVRIESIHANSKYLLLYQIDGLKLPHEYFILL